METEYIKRNISNIYSKIQTFSSNFHPVTLSKSLNCQILSDLSTDLATRQLNKSGRELKIHLKHYISYGNSLGKSKSPLSVRTSIKTFSDFHPIWCVGRPRPDMPTRVTSTRSKVKVKVTELLKLRKLHFSRSISSTVFVWSSKLMLDGDSMGPGLQLFRPDF